MRKFPQKSCSRHISWAQPKVSVFSTHQFCGSHLIRLEMRLKVSEKAKKKAPNESSAAVRSHWSYSLAKSSHSERFYGKVLSQMSHPLFPSKTSRDAETLSSQRCDGAEGVHLCLGIFTSHTFLLILHTGIMSSLKPFLALYGHATAKQQPLPKIRLHSHLEHH